jgi:hypothetical protein
MKHWTVGYGASYNPHRKEALELIEIWTSLEDCVREVTKVEAEKPCIMATDASEQNERSITYPEAKRMVASERVVLLLFGTAWGLVKEVFDQADHILDPIVGGAGYNHLSVRSAAAIILDRLAGRYLEG